MTCKDGRLNTGNPICSNKPQDLHDNAMIIDAFTNSDADFVEDRFGVDRLTLTGIQNKTDSAIVDFTGDAQTAIDGFEQLIDDKIIAQGGVEIANEWGDSPDKVLSQVFVKDNLCYVTPEMFGAVGDGIADDAAAFAEAVKHKCVFLRAGAVYAIHSTILNDSCNIINGNSATILKKTGAYLLTSNNLDLKVTNLTLDTSGNNLDDDRVFKLSGENINLESLKFVNDYDSFTSSNTRCIEVMDCKNLKMSNITTVKFSVFAVLTRINNLIIRDVVVDTYRLGIYFKDCTNVFVDNYRATKTSYSTKGSPGENGILIESSFKNASHNMTFSNCDISDSGEHGYRLGGAFTISDITFIDCNARNTGASVEIDNPASVEWHGGSGFKLLGGTVTSGQNHSHIKFINCNVYDVNDNPKHGINNHTGFNFGNTDNVEMVNCNTHSSESNAGYLALYFIGCSNFKFQDCSFNGTIGGASWQSERTSTNFWNDGCSNFNFNNCSFSQKENGAGFVLLNIGVNNEVLNKTYDNFVFDNCSFDAHRSLINVGSGNISNIIFNTCNIQSDSEYSFVRGQAPQVSVINSTANINTKTSFPDVKYADIAINSTTKILKNNLGVNVTAANIPVTIPAGQTVNVFDFGLIKNQQTLKIVGNNVSISGEYLIRWGISNYIGKLWSFGNIATSDTSDSIILIYSNNKLDILNRTNSNAAVYVSLG